MGHLPSLPQMLDETDILHPLLPGVASLNCTCLPMSPRYILLLAGRVWQSPSYWKQNTEEVTGFSVYVGSLDVADVLKPINLADVVEKECDILAVPQSLFLINILRIVWANAPHVSCSTAARWLF